MQTTQTAPAEFKNLDLSRIAQDLQIRKVQVEAVVQLLDEGNTIPFITRYRKERTGGLDEEVLRIIQERIGQLRHLAERKQTILRSIEGQGKLTDELRAAILSADSPKRLEDLYLPYKPKKRTLATTAREKGLEPLALAIWNSDPAVANLAEVLAGMLNPEKELNTPDDVLTGAGHVLAELIAETADIRGTLRNVLWDTGKLTTAKSDKVAEGQGLDYKDYFQFTEPLRHVPPHRILAINRGEKENVLTVKLVWDEELGLRVALERLPLPLPDHKPAVPAQEPPPNGTGGPAVEAEAGLPAGAHAGVRSEDSAPAPHAHAHPHPNHPHRMQELIAQRTAALQAHPHKEFLQRVTADALSRLLVPSLEREIRRELTQKAEGHAIDVFARNLRSKLLAPPLHGKRILAIDPGFRTGCKVAALDEHGNLLEEGVIFPHPPQKKAHDARLKLEELVRKHQTSVIAIGNGTACRETEELVGELISSLDARRSGAVAPSAAVPAAAEAPPPVPEPPPAPVVEASAPVAAEEPAPVPLVVEAPASGESVPAPSEIAPTPAPEAAAEAQAGPLPDLSGRPDGAHAGVQAPPPPPPAPPPPPPDPTVVLAHLPEAPADLAYVIVNEAGASVYSASPVAKEEFPQFDATLRGTISIGRRLQDPLSELVKIDPQHIGVGLYQHDLNLKQLKESLEGVIESCVNTVGVDLNTASVPLLRYVSGLNSLAAHSVVEHRKTNGPFRNLEQLLQVSDIGEKRFVQAAGFLKIANGDNPLDATWIHPESYAAARQLLAELGYGPEALAHKEQLDELRTKLKAVSPEEVANRLQVGLPTVRDLIDSLARPGRDPREDLPPPIFKKGVLKLEDLQPGMELKGSVLNVVDFGAFMDIGLKDSGLVHISQMANRYVKSPYDVVTVGDVVTVWVLSVDKERRRVSLTMISPGTERRPIERRPREPQGQRREGGPPRGQRREGPPPGQQAREGGPPHQGGRREGPPPGQRREGGGPPRGQRREGPPPGQRREGGGPPQAGRRLPPRGQTALGMQDRQKGRGQGPHGQGQPAPQAGTPPAETPPAQAQQTEQGAQSQTPAEQPARTPPQQQQQRKPQRRQPPKANLSQDALAGATPLNTFGELAAFWEARRRKTRKGRRLPQARGSSRRLRENEPLWESNAPWRKTADPG